MHKGLRSVPSQQGAPKKCSLFQPAPFLCSSDTTPECPLWPPLVLSPPARFSWASPTVQSPELPTGVAQKLHQVPAQVAPFPTFTVGHGWGSGF